MFRHSTVTSAWPAETSFQKIKLQGELTLAINRAKDKVNAKNLLGTVRGMDRRALLARLPALL